MEVDAEGMQVRTLSITLPTGVQLDLAIIFEALPEYCEDCHRLGNKKGECQTCDADVEEG